MSATIWVSIDQDEDGYPPCREEELVASAVGDARSTWRIESVPIFAMGLAVGDVVETSLEPDGRRYATDIQSESGRSTIRVVLFDVNHHDRLLQAVSSCSLEALHTTLPRLFAVDVSPDVSLSGLLESLATGRRLGWWDVEIGVIGSSHDPAAVVL